MTDKYSGPMICSDLIIRWNRLFDDAEPAVRECIYDDVTMRYSEPHRFYHTLEHIKACLGHLDHCEPANKRRNIELALWFHDAIYNPFAKDNEEKSARYAAEALHALGEKNAVIQQVMHLIRLTQHPSEPKTEDEKYLIDIDLSILGASEAVYSQYEKWIRQEYRRIPGFLYKRGRRKVLRAFLDQERIYSTDAFYNSYETKARRNLKQALENVTA